MNPRSARRILSSYLEDSHSDPSPDVQKALTVIGDSPELNEEFKRQIAIDKQIQGIFEKVDVPDDAMQKLASKIDGIPARRFNPRDPAMISVLIGFLLLIAVLTWNFLGRPAAFPADAIGLAEEILKSDDQTLELVGQPAGSLEDWFVLKGFDGFKVPARLAKYQVSEAAIVKIDSHPVAIVTVPDQNAQFVAFSANSLGIEITPYGTWRMTQLDMEYSIGIREEKGMCFMVIRRGKLDDLAFLLTQEE
jgi:hypothetical protein